MSNCPRRAQDLWLGTCRGGDLGGGCPDDPPYSQARVKMQRVRRGRDARGGREALRTFLPSRDPSAPI